MELKSPTTPIARTPPLKLPHFSVGGASVFTPRKINNNSYSTQITQCKQLVEGTIKKNDFLTLTINPAKQIRTHSQRG